MAGWHWNRVHPHTASYRCCHTQKPPPANSYLLITVNGWLLVCLAHVCMSACFPFQLCHQGIVSGLFGCLFNKRLIGAEMCFSCFLKHFFSKKPIYIVKLAEAHKITTWLESLKWQQAETPKKGCIKDDVRHQNILVDTHLQSNYCTPSTSSLHDRLLETVSFKGFPPQSAYGPWLFRVLKDIYKALSKSATASPQNNKLLKLFL